MGWHAIKINQSLNQSQVISENNYPGCGTNVSAKNYNRIQIYNCKSE